MRFVPPRMVGPAAVRMLAFRLATGPEDTGWYVLGNGSAFGADSAPMPGGTVGAVSDAAWTGAGTGSGSTTCDDGDPPNAAHPATATTNSHGNMRVITRNSEVAELR
jgi:hypothetical protein